MMASAMGTYVRCAQLPWLCWDHLKISQQSGLAGLDECFHLSRRFADQQEFMMIFTWNVKVSPMSRTVTWLLL